MTHKTFDLNKRKTVQINKLSKKLENKHPRTKWQQFILDRAKTELKQIKQMIDQNLKKLID